MAKDQEVERIAKKLDKMVNKNNTVSARASGRATCSIRKQVASSCVQLTCTFTSSGKKKSLLAFGLLVKSRVELQC